MDQQIEKQIIKPQHILDFSKFSEIRQLVDNISFRLDLKNNKEPVTISLLSYNKNEGKSLTAIVLATAFSRYLNKKILVIDTVMDGGSLKEYEVASDNENDIISKTCFPFVSLVHISNLKLHEYQVSVILDEVKDDYDIILFDTSALSKKNSKNIDPVVLARRCQYNYLIVSRETSSLKNLSRLKSLIEKNDLRIDGVMFNEVDHVK